MRNLFAQETGALKAIIASIAIVVAILVIVSIVPDKTSGAAKIERNKND